jgi:hypothetical protein
VTDAGPSPILIELIRDLPQILQALGTVVVAMGTIVGVVLAYRNGQKADQISSKADVAAFAATGAHTQAAAIQVTSNQIAEQTNGHMTALRNENQGLREMATSLLTILAARERNPTPVRREDLSVEGGPGVVNANGTRPSPPASGAIVIGRRSTDDGAPPVS